MELPKFAECHSNDKVEKLFSVIREAGYNKGSSNDQFKYFHSLCQYSCLLPEWQEMGRYFSDQYKQVVLDTALMNAIENGKFLTWFRITTPLWPVSVPRSNDEQSLFHSVCTAMFGSKDYHHTLQKLMEKSVPDMAESLFARWQAQNPNLCIEKKHMMWSKIIGKLQGRSSSTLAEIGPFLSIASYVLANVIYRPIFVIDCPSFTSSSHSSASLDMEGIFLPLERSPADCWKSPIILCHKDSHFCPMMFQTTGKNGAFVPLNKSDLSLLPIRYLTNDTVFQYSQYLSLKEIHVESQAGNTINLLCCDAALTPLPEHLNSVNVHFQRCQEIFRNLLASQNTFEAEKQKHHQYAEHPFHHIDENSQTHVVKLSQSNESQMSSPSPFSFSSSKKPLTVTGFEGPVMEQSMSTAKKATYEPGNNVSVAQNKSNKCVTPGCFNKKDSDIGEVCESCFKKHTVVESGLELVSIHDGGNCGYAMRQALPHVNEESCPNYNAAPSREMDNTGNKAYSEINSIPLLSVMNESCKMCSKYLCSKNTHPYCHECSKNNACATPKDKLFSQNAASAAAQCVNAKDREPAQDILYQQPLNPNPSQNRRAHITGSKEGHQIEDEPHPILCGEERHSFVFGQAECISPTSDESLIEVSQAPSIRHKCVSPVCETLISASQALCEKCQNILISYSRSKTDTDIQSAHKDQHKDSKSDWGSQPTISTQRAGTFSGVIATNTSASNVSQGVRVHSEKIRTVPLLDMDLRSQEEPKIPVRNFNDDDMNLKHNSKKHPFVAMNVPISAHKSSATPIDEQVTFPSSVSRAVDSEFEATYQRFTKEQWKDNNKCQRPGCLNFGNQKKQGYCNACYANLTEEERHVAIFGRTVCDLT